MALNSSAILDAVASHALATGHFESVSLHEPRNLGSGIAACIALHQITPIRSSGQGVTTVRLALHVHVYRPTLAEPESGTDVELTNASNALMAAYMGDFTLGRLVRCVDVFGAQGDGVDVATGTFEHVEAPYRFHRIRLPLVVDDVYPQAA